MNVERADALRQITELAQRHDLSSDDVLAALQGAPAPSASQRTSSILARVLAYLGGILVLAGIALLVGLQWEHLAPAARVLVTLGSGFAIFLLALATLGDDRFARATTPLLLVAAVLQPVGLVVMLNEYAQGSDPRHGLLFVCGVMLVQQLLSFIACRRTTLLFVSLFFGAAGFGLVCDLLEVDFEITALALGTGLMAIAWTLDRSMHRSIAPLAWLAGSVFFLAGCWGVLEGTALEVAFIGIAAGVMYLATVVQSRVLLVVSVLALMSFTGYYFADSLASAFGLIVMGLLLVGLSALAVSLDKRYLRGKARESGQG